MLKLDDLSPVFKEGSGSLFSFNTLGNIYIGGTPDLHRMTGSKYATGFSGCIHRLKIGINEIHSFMDFALKGVNVTPCPRYRKPLRRETLGSTSQTLNLYNINSSLYATYPFPGLTFTSFSSTSSLHICPFYLVVASSFFLLKKGGKTKAVYILKSGRR
ncbi:Basement membrane proteoglycan [Armadillidium vulgare]|nr:Basement membrane proteoglycan [Armadillidium vulgare]